MARQMWIGTRGQERWMKAPRELDTGEEGWAGSTGYLNGGRKVRHSKAGSRRYGMEWAGTRDEVRFITDLHDGVYDAQDGVNLIYFISLEAADKNVAPQNLAFPAQVDAMPLVTGRRPELVPTAANSLNYPARSALYTLTSADEFASVYVPIPPGYSAWLGAHGAATGTAALQVAPVGGTPADATLLPVTTTTRVIDEFTGAAGIDIALAGEGTITLAGVIIQVLPIGVSPTSGGYISGQGNSGCQFLDRPTSSVYQVAAGSERVGVSAVLVETGAWL